MKEINDILFAFDEAIIAGKKMALATVVHVSGSSYRRPGARMLVTEDGNITGAISGGCLEGDALRKAVLAITQVKKKLVVYNTLDEDDAKLGIQLGCNGIVSILFEPVDKENCIPIKILRKVITNRIPSVILTGYSINTGEHLGTFLPGDTLPIEQKILLNLSDQVLINRFSSHSELILNDNQQKIFFEYFAPAVSLIIVGAGNDVMPLVGMAKLVGWVVTMVDGRLSHANRLRFPNVGKIIVGKPYEVIEQLVIDNRTAVLLMTHNYNYDIEMLGLLKNKSLQYIGLLGPAAKRERMFGELSEKGISFTENEKENIYGPTGLNIGAETSAEIALSICSEIIAVLEQKDPSHLKLKQEPIHRIT